MAKPDPWLEIGEPIDLAQPAQQPMANVETAQPVAAPPVDAPAPQPAPQEDFAALAEPVSTPAQEPAPGLAFDASGNVIHPDTAPSAIQASDTGLIGERGGTHSEDNPKLAGANAALNAMFKARTPLRDIVGYLKSRGETDASVAGMMPQIAHILKWQEKNPTYKGDFRVDIERVAAPNSLLENVANSDLGVATASAADAATGFTSDNVIGAVGGDAEAARQGLAASQAAHPTSATLGTVAGGVTGALGAEGAVAKAGVSKALQPLAGDVLYGAVGGAGATDHAADGSAATATDRLVGAGKGAIAAAAGNLAGTAAAKGARGLTSGASDRYVAAVNSADIPTTVGQQYGKGRIGGIIKRTEDRIAGLPVVGDLINARRKEGIVKFNHSAFNHALKPIGANIGQRVGEDAIDHAQNAISDAFEKALKGKAVQADAAFAKDFTDAVIATKALPRVGEEVADNVKVILEPYMKQGAGFSGEAMQQMSRELRDLKAGYVQDPMKRRIGTEIDKIENSIFGMFRRQAPEVMPAYNAAKVSQRRLYTLADAVNKAKNKEGIFMPAQLGAADRTATVRTQGKVSAARGQGQFHDLQRAAQEVLPSEIPDSGTAGRFIIPGMALGLGGASDASGATHGAGMTLAGILTLAYSRAGQRLLTKPGRGIGGTAGKLLSSGKTQRVLSVGGGSTGALIANH